MPAAGFVGPFPQERYRARDKSTTRKRAHPLSHERAVLPGITDYDVFVDEAE